MTDEVTPNTGEPPVTPQANWWIDENMPGSGDRPTWLNEKFKSVADLAQSYSELEKRVGTAPDDYDMSKSKYIDSEYAPFQELKELAKSKRVPAEVMDKMLESVDKYLDEFSIDYKEEFKKLGDNAKERLETLDNWAKANLSPESFEALTSNMKSADTIKALEEIRNKMMSNGVVVPSGNESSANTTYTVADLQEEMTANIDKYKTDPKYRAEMARKIELAAKTSGYVDKNM